MDRPREPRTSPEAQLLGEFAGLVRRGPQRAASGVAKAGDVRAAPRPRERIDIGQRERRRRLGSGGQSLERRRVLHEGSEVGGIALLVDADEAPAPRASPSGARHVSVGASPAASTLFENSVIRISSKGARASR